MDLTEKTYRCETCDQWAYRHHIDKLNPTGVGGKFILKAATYYCVECKKHFRHPLLYKIISKKSGRYTKELYNIIMDIRKNNTLKETSRLILNTFGLEISPSTINTWEMKWEK